MKIVVCIKQVPEVTEVQVDPKTGTLIREGVQAILNPFCEYALDQAVKLASLVGGSEVIALTMGPLQARAALMRCLELGADRGILLSHRKFAGADTWATAHTLAAAIRQFVPDFDLVLLGKQAIDGDTAQVGPEIAEILSIAQITYAIEIRPGEKRKRIQVKRECEEGYELIETMMPAVITVSRGESVRRFPSLQDYINAKDKPVQIVGAGEIPVAEEELGLVGSFTQVVKINSPKSRAHGEIKQFADADEAARELFNFLQANGFIK